MQKIWNVKNKTTTHDIKEIVKIISAQRNFLESDITNDQNPLSYAKTHDKFKTLIEKNITGAIELITDAIKNNKPIIIHGDYDADGQTATAILFLTIKNDLNYQNVFTYIPNRFDEGYGLTKESIDGMSDLLKQNNFEVKAALIITVDCGIVSQKEVTLAKQLGFKIIISDHHHSNGQLPECDEIVWTTYATGAGISWLISQMLLEKYNIDESEKYLELAAIGTICDLQPLTELNRQIAKIGLKAIQDSQLAGIKALIEVAKIELPIDTYHIGWVIGPRLNATGRLEDTKDSLNLLIESDPQKANQLATNLNEINITRQNKTQNDFEYALKEFDTQKEIPNFIITASTQYHEGIIGLVAGKLMQKFNRPSIAIAIDTSNQTAKGSARSIKGVSIIKNLQQIDHLFLKLGGHDMAAGFSIKIENIEKLNKLLNEEFKIEQSLLIPQIDIELEISHDVLTLELFNETLKLHPFGVENQEPIFLSKDFKVLNFEKIGKEKTHLKIFLQGDNNKNFTAIMWSAPFEIMQSIGYDKTADIVFTLGKNVWNGKTSLDIKIKDIVFK